MVPLLSKNLYRYMGGSVTPVLKGTNRVSKASTIGPRMMAASLIPDGAFTTRACISIVSSTLSLFDHSRSMDTYWPGIMQNSIHVIKDIFLSDILAVLLLGTIKNKI